mmetsp:Transcript_53184/g.149866  ORF Transcript_53184/g.149866 Transcript_53184/m.149866 type:complete len:249 (+) Transcript_53184:760-1506(+)
MWVSSSSTTWRFDSLYALLTHSRASALGVNLLRAQKERGSRRHAASRQHQALAAEGDRAGAEALAAADQAEERRLAREVAETFCYFSCYTNGKAAVRLWSPADGAPVRPAAGVHRSRHIRGRSHVCGGPGAPVVLHYANCGFETWWRKYEVLDTLPPTHPGNQGAPPCRPRGAAAPTAAGAADDRHVDANMYMHNLARDLVKRGARAEAEAVYRQRVCLEGMLPRLASHGLAVRVAFPSALLLGRRRR